MNNSNKVLIMLSIIVVVLAGMLLYKIFVPKTIDEATENNDIVKNKDNSGNTVEYKIYDKYTVKADDLECTSQETNGKTEITLITCTNNKNKRLILKGTKI